jgi:hypothetical protein
MIPSSYVTVNRFDLPWSTLTESEEKQEKIVCTYLDCTHFFTAYGQISIGKFVA